MYSYNLERVPYKYKYQFRVSITASRHPIRSDRFESHPHQHSASAMAAACSSPAFMVVEKMLQVLDLTPDAPGPEWVSVECDRKEAYGCGGLGCADLDSFLSIGLSEEAVRSIQEELGVRIENQGFKGELPAVEGYIATADVGVLLLLVTFRRWHHGEMVYYLLYDSEDSSFYMIPYTPRFDVEGSLTPAPIRLAGCRGHELALTAAARVYWRKQPFGPRRGRLCLCTPATRADSGSTYSSPWEMEVLSDFPRGSRAIRQPFSLDVMFSFADKIFWVDLSQGVAYSDLSGLVQGEGEGEGEEEGSAVDIDVVFISLPEELQIVLATLSNDAEIDRRTNMSRTIGCVNGSIKLVCIMRSEPRRAGNELVKVWTLDLDRKLWNEDKDWTCPWEDLWKKHCLMNAGLKDNQPLEPQYPVLTPDGALCLLLPKTRRRRLDMNVKRPYIFSFDMLNRSCLSFGQVHSYYVLGPPFILPYNFFKNCCPAPKRKPPTTKKRKLPSIDRQADADVQP